MKTQEKDKICLDSTSWQNTGRMDIFCLNVFHCIDRGTFLQRVWKPKIGQAGLGQGGVSDWHQFAKFCFLWKGFVLCTRVWLPPSAPTSDIPPKLLSNRFCNSNLRDVSECTRKGSLLEKSEKQLSLFDICPP